MPRARRGNRASGSIAGPHPHAREGAATVITGQSRAIHQGSMYDSVFVDVAIGSGILVSLSFSKFTAWGSVYR